jgi:hypothetical protein
MSSFETAVRNCDEVSSSSPEKFQAFLDHLVNAYHRHHVTSTRTEWKSEKIMLQLRSKLFSGFEEDGDDGAQRREGNDRTGDGALARDEKERLERMIEELATDAILILKKAVGQDWTADALAETLLTECACGAELASSMHEVYSRDKEKLQRSFARGTFGMVKRLESVRWRTQVGLFDSSNDGETNTNTAKKKSEEKGNDEVTAVLELCMEKNETTSIEFKKEELFTFFKELETIQMKIDDLNS